MKLQPALCRPLLLLALPALLAVPASLPVRADGAAGTEKEKKEEDKGKEEPKKFTNEDLEAMRTGRRPASAPAAGEESVDPLKRFRDEQERAAWRQRQLAGLRKEIAGIEAQIEYWEKKKLSLRNPLYPRPTPPGEAPGENREEGEEEGLDAVQQIEAIDGKILDLREKLESTRERLRKMEEEFRKPAPPAPAAGAKPAPEPGKRPEVPYPASS